MAENENKAPQQEKVQTKYDLKMQRRAEEKEKAKKEEQRSRIGGILLVVALFAFVISFPIRSYLTVNGTYVEIGGEKISRVEWDYNFNVVKNNFLNSNSYYLSMFGIDLTGDLESQSYSDTMSWQDYFEQSTVEAIATNIGMRNEAKAAGFTYDTAAEYADYQTALSEAAATAGVSVADYIESLYGTYATESRIKDFVLDGMYLSAYYDQISDGLLASSDEITSYYNENVNSYDSVDYRVLTISAELPTEPTDLADPVEETESAENTEATESTETEEEEEEEYEPSEAEIAYAMEQAKVEADLAATTTIASADLTENMTYSSVNSNYRDWLFEEGREAGDVTVVANDTTHQYYVVQFENRYLDQTPTVSARVIIVVADAETSADAIYEEYLAGEQTEDAFAALADAYEASAEGGLYEGLASSSMSGDLGDWLFAEGRSHGDVTVIDGGEESSSYVVYFVEQGEAEWYLNIQNTLLSSALSDYLEAVAEGYDLTNDHGNLNYDDVLASVEAAESAAAEAEESAEESSEEASESATE